MVDRLYSETVLGDESMYGSWKARDRTWTTRAVSAESSETQLTVDSATRLAGTVWWFYNDADHGPPFRLDYFHLRGVFRFCQTAVPQYGGLDMLLNASH